MGTIAVAKQIGRWRGDDRDVDVNFFVLDCLPPSPMRPQNSRAAHPALGTIIAQRPVHAPLDVIDYTGLHQIDRTLLAGERRARKPYDISDAQFRSSLQRHHRDAVSIAQMMVGRDHHAIPQPALAQCSRQIVDVLVSVRGIVSGRSYGRAGLPARGAILANSHVRNLLAPVDYLRNHAADAIFNQYSFFDYGHANNFLNPNTSVPWLS